MKSLLILLAIFLSAAHALAQEPVWSKKYHAGSVTCLDFSGDGGKLLSGSYDQTIRLWDVAKGDTDRTFKNLKTKIDNVDFNKTDEWFIASWVGDGGYDTKIYTSVINLDSGLVKSINNTPPYSTQASPSRFSYAEHLFSMLTEDDSTFIVLTSGTKVEGPGSSRNGIVGKFKFSTNTLAINSYNLGTIDVWCINKKHKKIFSGGDFEIYQKSGSTVFHKTGMSFEMTDFERNSIRKIRTSDSAIRAAIFTFDENSLLLAKETGEINIYTQDSINTGTDSLTLSERLTTATSPAIKIASDLRGRYYISAHEDSTLRLWTPGIPNIFKRILLKSPVSTIAVSPDSVHFATAHTDGTVALWDIMALANSAPTDTVFTSVAEENPFKNTTLSAEPNPFKNSTTIRFSLEKPLKIKLAVTDILGREVAVLKDGFTEIGEQDVVFKNEDLPNGTYFITLSGDGLLKTIPVNIAR